MMVSAINNLCKNYSCLSGKRINFLTTSKQNYKQINEISNLCYYPLSFKKSMPEHLQYGAKYQGNGKTKFTYIAPEASNINVEIAENNNYLTTKKLKLKKDGEIFSGEFDIPARVQYRLILEKKSGEIITTYDPYADYLPNDISTSTEIKNLDGLIVNYPIGYKEEPDWAVITDHSQFKWEDEEWMNKRKRNPDENWHLPSDMIAMDFHVGIAGGFKEAEKRLDKIAQDGVVNTIKLMPIGEFYGDMNWGYDESCKYAVENSYGTPDDFKSFVNKAHKNNLRVVLDVVPNHFGPYGTNISQFMPVYSKEGKTTPWGTALEFNKNDYAKNYMTNMLMNWAVNYHIDGFRFDAMHNMDSDDATREMVGELRTHDETKDIILYPEDMRFSRVLANKNLPKKIDEFNWGYDGFTTFDFQKTITALTLGHTNRGVEPNVYAMEYLYRNGVHKTHEDEMAYRNDVDPSYREYCRKVQGYPWFASDNAVIGLSNHDEIGNDAGGKRNFTSILYSRLDMFNRMKGDWKKADVFINEMMKYYIEYGKTMPEDEQLEMGCKYPVPSDYFEKHLFETYNIDKLAIGAMFMHPSPKEFFMGDADGEISPFKYFTNTPLTEVYARENLNNEKGYDTGLKAFMESHLYSDDKQIKDKFNNFSNGISQFSKDFAKCLRENKPLSKASFDNIVTYSYPDKNILEVKYYDNQGNETIAVMNFSGNSFGDFRLNTTSDIVMKPIINSTDVKYGGKYHYDVGKMVTSSSVTIPPYSIVLYEKV